MLTYIVIIYLALLLIVFVRQDSYIFFPVKGQYGHIAKQENVEAYGITIEGVELHGWLVNSEYARDKLVIYYGGNAEDVYWNIGEHYDKAGYALLLVNYRGYGLSGGSPGEKRLFADAVSIYDDVTKKYEPRKMILYGRSLGSGVAAYLSSVRRTDGMILVSPYDSIVNMAKKQFPYFPVALMLKHRFDSISYMKDYSGPLCIIYGGRDSIIPPARTQNLMRHLSQKPQLVAIEAADHNDIAAYPEYEQTVQGFIGKI